VIALGLSIAAPGPAAAQDASGLPGLPGALGGIDPNLLSNPALIDAIRRQIEASGQPGALPGAAPTPTPQVQAPPAAPAPATATAPTQQRIPTPLERVYSARLGQTVAQFGYDMLRGGGPPTGQTVGSVPESYLLGVGDQLVITLRGNVNDVVTAVIDREGRVTIPGLPPLPAANRTFGDFKALLARAIRDGRLNTEAFVSLGQIRQITITVGGQVAQPGVRRVPALATVIEALAAAGGVDPSGSLRAVRVNRRAGAFALDLYDLLLGNGISRDITLLDGDQIIVPTIGATVAIGGAVKRPGVYELPAGAAGLDAAAVLGYAGGPLIPVGNVVQHITSQPDGQMRVVETRALAATTMRDGDVLALRLQEQIAARTVTLAGAVLNPGLRSVAAARSVRELIPNRRALSPEAYLAAAVLHRPDGRSLSAFHLFDLGAEIGVGVAPVAAARGARPAVPARVELREGDEVIVLTQDDVRFLASQQVQQTLRGEVLRAATIRDTRPGLASAVAAAADNAPAGGETCRGLRRLASVIDTEGTQRFAESVLFSRSLPDITPQTEQRFLQSCPEIFDTYPDLLAYLLENSALLAGEVQRPGLYPIAPDIAAARVVAAAGGFTRNANLAQSEIGRLYAGSAAQAGQAGAAAPAPATADSGARTLRRFTVDLRGAGVAQLRLWPGDVLRIQPLELDRLGGVIVVSGELRRPGVFEVRRGERLSDVLRRAGGLTPEAYPIGAVFTRSSAREAEQAANQRAATEFEQALGTALLANASAPAGTGFGSGDALRVGREIAAQLRQNPALGRIVVEADPAVLAAQPDRDILVEPGDRLVIPRRPLNLTVIGAVLNPGAVRFDPRATVGEYVRLAGGYRDDADRAELFVVLPNGEARPVGASFWNFEQVALLPGSTIVVPRDAAPLRLFPLAIGLGDILSKLAITAASIAVIGRGTR